MAFALVRPAYFAVMFDPQLLRMSDPDLMAERDKAFSDFFAAVSQTPGLPIRTGLRTGAERSVGHLARPS